MRETLVTLVLPVKLTMEEVVEKATYMAIVALGIEAAEEARKADQKIRKNSIDDARGEVIALSEMVRDREEERLVRCAIRPNDLDPATVVVVRLDTHEVIETRLLTEEERQQVLDMPGLDESANRRGATN
jgi:hypothetical protein